MSFQSTGRPQKASGAEVLAGANDDRFVTPAGVVSHPGVAKGYIIYNGTGTPVILNSFNVDLGAGITDVGTGVHSFLWDVDFASANYALSLAAWLSGSNIVPNLAPGGGPAAGQVTVETRSFSGAGTNSAADCTYVSVVAWGAR